VSLIVIGMNHRTAPIALREALAVPGELVADVNRRCLEEAGAAEAMVLSTCNRVEVYAVMAAPPEECRARIGALFGGGRRMTSEEVERYGYLLKGEEAIRHIMRVCSSLDSLVVGEAQILGQVKEALAIARRVGAVGPVLDRTLQAALRAAKEVRTRTGIARSAVSIGSVAVDLARRIFPTLAETRVLVLGAGKMGQVTARALAQAGVYRVYVANRSYERALELAGRHGWHARQYAELDDLLATVDVVLTCTGAQRPIIDTPRMKQVVRRRKYRPIFLVDIALPRDVEPAVGDLDTVYLYNIDDLEAVSAEHLEQRRSEAEEAERIVDDAVLALSSWHRTLRIKPTVAAIRRRADGIIAAELRRATARKLSGLDEVQQEALRAAVRAVVNKLLHPAMASLRESAEGGEGVELAAAARTLFGLDGEPEIDDDDGVAESAAAAPEAEGR